MKWNKRAFYYESDNLMYVIWHIRKKWKVDHLIPYFECGIYVDHIFQKIGVFNTLKDAKNFVEWYDKEGE